MTKSAFEQAILATETWDTHTHLDTSESRNATSIWDIIHYFWFERELIAAGYPTEKERATLSEEERTTAFLKAFTKAGNTYWSWVFRRILSDLYAVREIDESSLRGVDGSIRETGADSTDWITRVVEKLHITSIAVGPADAAVPAGLGNLFHRIPTFDPDQTSRESSPEKHAEQLADMYEERFGKTVRLSESTLNRFMYSSLRVSSGEKRTPAASGDTDPVVTALLRELDKREFNLQLFIGTIGRWPHPVSMWNDTDRVLSLYPLFEAYPHCTFEIANAANLSNLDIVQAARTFPNVMPGGLWWFDFRASVYREVFQYRVEALPSSRSCIIASDARCIEWCYGKVLLVKTLLADFLFKQVEEGWLDEALALRVARDWLHDTAATLQRTPETG